MFKEFFKENKIVIIETIVISILVAVTSFIFCGHYRTIFIDRGRELLIPLSILDGGVLYKSILAIYSPLSYFINALGMLFLGKNISTLYILGTVNCCIFLSAFYFLCHKFLNRMLSWLLVLVVLSGCIGTDGIINFIFGHSFGMTYGLTAYIISVFCSIKFLETKNINYFLLTSFFAGVTISLKLDFFTVIFIPLLLSLMQRTEKTDILKAIGLLFSVPVLTLCILFIQGLTFHELVNAVKFMFNFADTEAMTNFYKSVGALPDFNLVKIFRYFFYFGEFLLSVFLIYTGLYFYSNKDKFVYPLIICSVLSLLFIIFIAEPYYHFVFFPLILLIFFIVNFKRLIQDEKFYILLFALFGLLIRVWADLRMNFYGIYALPFVYLIFTVLIKKYLSQTKIFSKINVEYFLVIFLFIHAVYFFLTDVKAREINSFPVQTAYGTIYLPQQSSDDANNLIKYIHENTSGEDKILVLPEGQMINFLCGRKSDMNLHMLDRLYYEALGEDKSTQLLKDGNYDYIIIIKGYGSDNFGKKYLYSENNSVTKYIDGNYQSIKIYGDNNNHIDIKKKKVI